MPLGKTEIDYFSDPEKFYRVVRGQDVIDDIIESGKIRTSGSPTYKGAGNIEAQPGKVNLSGRPTSYPSFSKGNVNLDYALGDPEHYIIESSDKSIRPSTMGRHGKGSTHFPVDEAGNPIKEFDAKKTKIFKHVGDGQYETVGLKGTGMGPNFEIAPEFRGTIKVPPRPQPSESQRMAEMAQKRLREEQAVLNSQIARKKKASDLLQSLKDLETYGGDLEKYPGGIEGQAAKKARGTLMTYGNKLAELPGEGSALEKIRNNLLVSKYGKKEVALPPAENTVIDVKATPVKSKATGLGKYASGIVGGLARGLAEAPKYEFLNPPSAGPSDPNDPVYQFERGLISQAEFNRRMGK